jgi:CDP-glucose 4,6-dehydratase
MQTVQQSNWKNRRVFVTGATGFIGSHLCEELLLRGADLKFYAHTKFLPQSALYFRGDLRNKSDDLIHFLRDFQPEVVFHLAAQPIVCRREVDETETLEVNLNGTFNILHACKDLSSLKSFVHVSTDKVFGNANPITKDTVLDGTGHPYNTSKLAGDFLAQMYSNFYDIPMVVLRHANVYGAGDVHFDRIVPRTIRKVLRGERPVIRGDGTNSRDYLHVDDVVEGYLRAAELPRQNKLTLLNLGGYNHSVGEVVDSILAKMRRIDVQPIYEEQWHGEIPHQHIVNDLAAELIGWNPPTDLDCGLDKTIPWYVEKNMEIGEGIYGLG